MAQTRTRKEDLSLKAHLQAVKQGKRRFENAFQGVARMILAQPINKVVVNGRPTYDFEIFRSGGKHAIGMYDEINSFVSFVKDAAEGGSSKEMSWSVSRATARPSSSSTCAPSTATSSASRRIASIPSASPAWISSAATGRSR